MISAISPEFLLFLTLLLIRDLSIFIYALTLLSVLLTCAPQGPWRGRRTR